MQSGDQNKVGCRDAVFCVSTFASLTCAGTLAVGGLITAAVGLGTGNSTVAWAGLAAIGAALPFAACAGHQMKKMDAERSDSYEAGFSSLPA